MRRLRDPLVAQLRQGASPDALARAVALGVTLGIFPILGATTLLCAIVAHRMRLNQPTMQLVNYVAYPAQLALLLPFYRAGEVAFGVAHRPLAIPALIAAFRADPWAFLRDYGLVGLRGVAVWCVVAPAVGAAIYYAARAPLRAAAQRIGPAAA